MPRSKRYRIWVVFFCCNYLQFIIIVSITALCSDFFLIFFPTIKWFDSHICLDTFDDGLQDENTQETQGTHDTRNTRNTRHKKHKKQCPIRGFIGICVRSCVRSCVSLNECLMRVLRCSDSKISYCHAHAHSCVHGFHGFHGL